MILQTHVAQTLPDNGKIMRRCARRNEQNQLKKLEKQQLIQDVQWIEHQALDPTKYTKELGTSQTALSLEFFHPPFSQRTLKKTVAWHAERNRTRHSKTKPIGSRCYDHDYPVTTQRDSFGPCMMNFGGPF